MFGRALGMVCLLLAANGLLGCTGNSSGSDNNTNPPLDGIFVATTGTDNAGCGTSWAAACATPQMGSDRAVADGETSVFVAAGTYRPLAANGSVLTMADGITLYGGFLGTEASLADRPDPSLNPSILDADFAGDDPAVRTDNSWHVVIGANSASLDGFIVRGGRPDVTAPRGGGMLNESLSDVAITQVIFQDNRVQGVASGSGGAIYNEDVTGLTLTSVEFIDNAVTASMTSRGGAFYSDNASPNLDNVLFNANGINDGNPPQQGGAMYVTTSDLTLNDVIFSDNLIQTGEGAALYANPDDTSTLSNVTFERNGTTVAGYGAGFFLTSASGFTVDLSGVEFTDNFGPQGSGTGLYVDGSTVTISDSQFAGSTLGEGTGAGLLAVDATPTLNRVIFSGNAISSYGFGGGLAAVDSTTTLNQVTFENNSVGAAGNSSVAGGAIYFQRGSASVANARFQGNDALGMNAFGGGVTARNMTFLGRDLHFIDNEAIAVDPGDDDARGGGLHSVNSILQVTNASFSVNRVSAVDSARGAGIAIEGPDLVTLTNVTFASNTGSASGTGTSDGDSLAVEGGSLTATNLLFGDNDIDAAIEIGAIASIANSCSDQNLNALTNVTVTNANRSASIPTELALSQDAFLIPFSGCENRGNNTIANNAFLPEDWRDQSTRLDKRLDVPDVDAGVHRDESQDLWIESLAIDGVTASWTGNYPFGTTCDFVVTVPTSPDIIGSLTEDQVQLGSVPHGALFAPTGLQFTCTFQGYRVAGAI